MKEYDAFELYVVGIMKNYDFKYFICIKENEEYVEIFKHNVIKVDDKSTIDAFAGYGPSREKAKPGRPQSAGFCNIKINFPLKMPRAKRRAFK